MSTPRHWLFAASTVLLVTACATPEERMAKLELKQQRLEIKAQQISQRNQARSALANATAGIAVNDQRQPLENVVKALAACDASFGATVKRFSTAINPLFPLTVKGEVAAINVPERQTPGRSAVAPLAEAKVYELPVIGYFDESIEVGGQSQKLAWGFYIAGGVDQVAATLGQRIPNFKRASKEINGNYTRMEIYDGAVWRRTSRFDHYRSQPDVAGERTMLIEASRDPAFPGTRVGCAVRGTAMLQIEDSLRPELN